MEQVLKLREYIDTLPTERQEGLYELLRLKFDPKYNLARKEQKKKSGKS
jgi:hypothetical protein